MGAHICPAKITAQETEKNEAVPSSSSSEMEDLKSSADEERKKLTSSDEERERVTWHGELFTGAGDDEDNCTGITRSESMERKDINIFQIQFVDEVHEGRAPLTVTVANSEEEFRNTRVKDLKRKLIPEDEYENTILIYERSTLKRNRTLGSYNVQHDSVITGLRRGATYTLYICKTLSSAGHEYEVKRPYEDDDDDDPKDIPRRWSMEIGIKM
ncbi:uncharacterized protein LOC130219632 [Danio aesculapii]|uniref:uncharacterized protein LOC130219632 n=1 Tax=Danio aesculapii TaxID=1142201 RepID=UPI0024BF699C|nr:uncharacterized protein LOC130219632 [Danio aesculapii]